MIWRTHWVGLLQGAFRENAKNLQKAIASGNRSKSRSGPLFRASAYTGMEYVGCGDSSVESAETLLLYTKSGPEEFLRKAVRRAANLI